MDEDDHAHRKIWMTCTVVNRDIQRYSKRF